LFDLIQQKPVHHLHIFPYKQVAQASAIQNMVAFWQKDREGHPKGIIYVELTSVEATSRGGQHDQKR
jgi:hypothetical protein